MGAYNPELHREIECEATRVAAELSGDLGFELMGRRVEGTTWMGDSGFTDGVLFALDLDDGTEVVVRGEGLAVTRERRR